MKKDILIISSSRADRYLLEPLAEKLGEDCELRNVRPFYGNNICLDSLEYDDKGKKIVLLGDRWETCLLAFRSVQIGSIIYHLHGGEVTAGSRDEYYRHAITKLAGIHLTAHQDFANRIIKMGEDPKCVFSTGALGVWRAKQISIPKKENKLIVIFHPNTISPGDIESEISSLLEALKSFSDEFKIKFYAPNHDNGRDIIERKIKAFIELYGGEYVEEEYGDDFLHSLAEAKCIIGNSSCGIIEAPSLKTPTVNVGNRQDGRPRAASVFNCGFDKREIVKYINFCLESSFMIDNYFKNPYDNVETDTVDMICDIIRNHPVKFQKRFID